MTSWSAKPLIRAGFYPSARDWEEFADELEKMVCPPMAVLTRAAAQGMTNGATTAVSFDTETLDTVNGHDLSTNPSRYICRTAGWYQLSGGIAYTSNATGIRTAQFAKNGTDIVGTQNKANAVAGGIVSAVPAWTVYVPLSVDDYVELLGFQNSGAAPLNTSTESNNLPTMYVRWVSEL